MESKFFSNEGNKFIFGDKPTVFDFALYHEILTAMLIPGLGRSNQMFHEDNRFRKYKVDKMNQWYYQMSREKINIRMVLEFTQDLNKK